MVKQCDFKINVNYIVVRLVFLNKIVSEFTIVFVIERQERFFLFKEL